MAVVRTSRRVMRGERKDHFAVLVGPFVLLAIWALISQLQLVRPILLPPPAATFVALWQGVTDGSLWVDLSQTLYRTFVAFAIATISGVPMGIVLGSERRIYRRVELLVDFFRSTPATAMFPLFLVVFGIGDVAKIAVATFAAWLVIVFNVAYGVMNASLTRTRAARLMGASRARIFRDITFFEALPQTFIGIRSAVSIAIVVIIVAEMFVGSTRGMGHRIIDAQQTYDMNGMYASIIVTGCIGYGLNLIFFLLERKAVHWTGK